MSNHNITQRGTQETGLGVMIGRCFPGSQRGWRGRHPTNVGCSFFRYTNDYVGIHNDQRPKRKTWSREYNQLAPHSYSRSNLSQRRYRKRMIEIRQECTSFQTTRQRLADQVGTMIKKGWFSDLEILEIHKKTNTQDNNTVPDIKSCQTKTKQKWTANFGKWKRHTTKQRTNNQP